MDAPLLGGKYRLVVELGRGGMASVYLAVLLGQAGFSKLQVIKRLNADLAEHPEFLGMFLDEARLAARIEHPNVVQTNEVGNDGREYYIAMEYLEGQSLDVVLRRAEARGGLPLDMHVRAIMDVLAGLHFAHELRDFDGTPLSVVHRDVSPHNVIVTYEGQVKLVDFGIAKAADSSAKTQGGVLKGKFGYMAPENFAGEPLDRRADIYAVGVMLWQAMTGARMWPRRTPDLTIAQRVAAGEIPTPRSVKPDASPALEAICMRALATNRAKRYETAAEFRDALEDFMSTRSARDRDIGKFVSELFADSRADIKAAIEARLRDDATSPQIPALRSLLGSAPPPSWSSVGDPHPANATVSESALAPRARRTPILTLLGILVVGLGAVAFAVGRFAAKPADRVVRPVVVGCSQEHCCSHAQCTDQSGGAAARCTIAGGACAPVVTPVCAKVVGDASDPNGILIGAIFPLSEEEDVESGRVSQDVVELALSEIQSAAQGLPGGPGGARRPVSAVVCDSGRDAMVAAEHLVKDLHVPVIIGPGRSTDAITLATRLTVKSDVLVICPTCASPALATLDARGLVWRTITSTELEGRVLAAALSDLEAGLRSGSGLAPGEPLRVALLSSKEFVTAAPANLFASSLRVNGRDAIANGNNFLRLDFAPDLAQDRPNYSPIVARLIAFAPHVVVALGDTELNTILLPAIEKGWPETGPRARPSYLLGSNGYSTQIIEFVRGNEALRKRVVGVAETTPRASVPAKNAYSLRYRSAYGELPGDPMTQVYDAVYMVIYAIAAAGDSEPLTGTAIAKGFRKLLSPAPVRIAVGPDDNGINRALATLSKGGRIDLIGASGELDFDESGELPLGDSALWCVSRTSYASAPGKDAGDEGLRIFETERTYDVKTGHFTGRFACP